VELAGQPRGTLQLVLASAAECFLSGPTLEGFITSYPDVRLDSIVSDELADIGDEGHDAGVRLGDVIDKDTIAIVVTDPSRPVVLGAPSCFASNPRPTHPRDLMVHAARSVGLSRRPRAWSRRPPR
jgi:DNA-binding transcriptional LysR family regulator